MPIYLYFDAVSKNNLRKQNYEKRHGFIKFYLLLIVFKTKQRLKIKGVYSIKLM